jgi:hypothetical protein
MKHRNASALALVSWCLIVPPTFRDPFAAKQREPLGQWKTVESFTSAAACADAQKKILGSFKTELDENRADIETRRELGLASEALCVASDDPRLKEK